MKSPSVAEMIDRWATDGLITADQERRMRADLPAPAHRATLVVEALGYLGGALVSVAVGLVAGRYWAELGEAGRPVVLAAAAAALSIAGAVVPRAAAGPAARLRAVLWLAACAAIFGLLLLVATDNVGWADEAGLSFAAAGALLSATGFWALHRHPVQHFATWLSALLLAASLVALLPRPGMLPGLAIWALGLAWAWSAWGGLIRPALLGRWLGALATAGGAVAIAGVGWGSALAVATVAGSVAAAIALRDAVVLAVASVAALLILPAVVELWFPGVLGAAMALLVVGLVLVGAAVLLARRRGPAVDLGAARPARPGH